MCWRKYFLILIIPFLSSCIKEQGADPSQLYTSPDFYIKLDNGKTEYRQTIGNVIAQASSEYRGSEYVESSIFIKKESQVGESFNISLAKIFYNTPTQNQTDSLFTIGTYRNFGTSSEVYVSVFLEHTDAQGIRWVTGTGQEQIGSYFQINSTELSAGPGFRYKVRGRFSCKLYDETLNYKQVSGEFVAKFGEGNL